MWKKVRLGDICENLDAKRVPITKAKRVPGKVPYYGASGIVDYVEGYIFNENLLLVSEDGANLLARTYPIAFSISGKTWVNNHAHVLRFKDECTRRFIEYYLNSISLSKFVSGMAQPKLNQKMLVSIPVSLPPLAEQQRIVAKLDAAFAEIDGAVEGIKSKEIEVQKLKTSLLSSSLGGNAVIWKNQKLNDVIEKGETINPTTNPNAKFSYIDVSSVDRASFCISKTQTLLGKDAPSRARRAVRTGDVLFATIRPTLQRVAVVPERLNGEVCSTGYIVLRPKANMICSKFIFYYMLSEKVNAEMEGLQTGASYPAVNDTQVKNLHISYPSLAEQQRIVSKLDAAFREIGNANDSIIKSKASYLELKSAILVQELQSEVA